MLGKTNGKHIIHETVSRNKQTKCCTNVQALCNAQIFGLQITAHPSESGLSKRKFLATWLVRARQAGPNAGAQCCGGLPFASLGALAASYRLFLCGGNIFNLFSVQKTQDALWVLQQIFRGPFSLCHMSIPQPITSVRRWSDTLIGLGLGYVLISSA